MLKYNRRCPGRPAVEVTTISNISEAGEVEVPDDNAFVSCCCCSGGKWSLTTLYYLASCPEVNSGRKSVYMTEIRRVGEGLVSWRLDYRRENHEDAALLIL